MEMAKPNLIFQKVNQTAAAEMQISGRYISAIIAKNINMPIDDFNRYNPGFDNVLATGSNYNLRLPNDKMSLFVANKYPILNECVNKLLSDVDMLHTKTVYKKRDGKSGKK